MSCQAEKPTGRLECLPVVLVKVEMESSTLVEAIALFVHKSAKLA